MIRVATLLVLATISVSSNYASAQEAFYVSDEQHIPLRSGPGSDYRILHRGIPSGTEMVINERSENGDYARITTARGTEGWIRSQYLTTEVPPRTRIIALLEKNQAQEEQLASVNDLLRDLRDNYRIMSGQLEGKDEELALTGGELAEIRRISSNALTLDGENRRLVENSEMQRSRIEVLEADNQRLLNSSENEAFLNGALAVALGVMITLLVPRLWPKRRRSTSWA